VPLAAGAAVIALVGASLGAIAGVRLASKHPSPTAASTPAPTGSPAAGAPSTSATGPLDVKSILAKVEPAVVDIVARERRGSGEGTGVIISPDGYVLTNAHVVSGATKITVTTRASSRALPATLVGADEGHDVALLHIAADGGVTPAELGRSADVKVGDDVVAIGNALGLRGDPTVTRGIVSGLNRTVEDLNGLIQTDAAINPGNSGGPLVNTSGQVIGINTVGAGEGAQNIGFAIPIDVAKAIAERLQSGQGPAPVAFLGINTTEPSDGKAGAAIIEVVPGGPAAQAGLAIGDRLVTFDGKPVEAADAIAGLVQAHQPGDTVEVVVDRRGSNRTLKVRLGSRPSN
jgi:putative serine protease PepD